MPDLNVGDIIVGRYKIERLIARGGFGDVYLATHLNLKVLRALKVLRRDALGMGDKLYQECSERFKIEAQLGAKLDHPNLVKAQDYGQDGEMQVLAMEYVPGGSLQDALNAQKRLASPHVIQIALALGGALASAHGLGIIHRDLKPANILLAEDGTPRITDFGCAFIIDQSPLTQAGVLVGTAYYLSPEAFRGGTIDARTDIWALGVVLFELLTGQRPFSAANFTATVMAILTKPVPDLASLAPETPQTLVDLVQRMLEKDPQERITSMRQVEDELKAIRQDAHT